ncbi:MAG: response regulator [Bacteroidetes bacterium]|nr:response regulator [Bacteroidota bacterium]MBU1719191.1 response regulator [Bacteroidota bacterium]
MKDNQNYKILVVDDSNTNNFLIEGILKKRGYNVTSVTRGNDALKLLKKEKRDLILLDLMMPGISGFDFLNQLKSDTELASIPVVVVSAKTGTKTEKQVLEAGAFSYVSKPLRIQNVLDVVIKALGQDKF